MNVQTGEIGSYERLTNDQRKLLESYGYDKEEAMKRAMQIIKPISLDNCSNVVRKAFESTGKAYISRNTSCPCGSGKRFKRCCMQKSN